MRTVRVAHLVPGPPAAVAAVWLDTERWPDWVDGLEVICEVRAPWPQPGGELIWRSGPAGRGEVTERVLVHQPGASQTVAVQDGQVTGEQTVAFSVHPEGTRVELALAYRLRRRNPVTVAVDILFIRRAMNDALAHTLERFAVTADVAQSGQAGQRAGTGTQ